MFLILKNTKQLRSINSVVFLRIRTCMSIRSINSHTYGVCVLMILMRGAHKRSKRPHADTPKTIHNRSVFDLNTFPYTQTYPHPLKIDSTTILCVLSFFQKNIKILSRCISRVCVAVKFPPPLLRQCDTFDPCYFNSY
jgi:hypothetical protein